MYKYALFTPLLPQEKRSFLLLCAAFPPVQNTSRCSAPKGENMTEAKTNKKNPKTLIIACGILAVLIIAFALIYFFALPKPTEGAKALKIEVVDDKSETSVYEVHTDAEFLRQAMEETEGLTFSGTESEYGLMVDTVNGLKADYSANAAYWAFYVDGEYCSFGIDSQPVKDGETYSIVYTID